MTQELSEKTKARRLDRAVEYVSDYWFPVNPTVLENVKLGLASGEYDCALSRLISDIKGDLSLYSYCLKNLIELLRGDSQGFAQDLSPIELLEQASLDQLKAILSIETTEVSRHSIEAGNPDQIARFSETMLSATTVEALAGTYSIDREDAFASAVLRQLGHTLIAWNYPGVYSDALTGQRDGQDLDIIISRTLGFSPQMLAIRVLNSWGVSEGRCRTLGILDELNQEQATITTNVGNTLSRICRVGEALARANDPERYPRAREDWQLAKAEIDRRLGKKGIDIIKERFQERCESYVTLIPHVFHDGFNFEYDLVEGDESDGQDSTAMVHRNPFIDQCQAHIAHQLNDLYRRINAEGPLRAHLRALIKEIIPVAGFSSGCIYTVDPSLGLLMPQTEIGRMELRKAKAVDYSIVNSNADLVSLAFQNEDPVLAYLHTESNIPYTAVATYFGANERIGVLYLEAPTSQANLAQYALVLHLKALACALNDCL